MKIVKVVDLSVPMDNDAGEPDPPHIEYLDHDRGAQQAADWFGLTRDDFPDGKAWANEYVRLSAHTGTHVDAPYHYALTSGGARARTIDELPLEWFFSDGVVLDFSVKEAGDTIEVSDLERELERIGYSLKPFDIVMIRTDTDKKFYQKDYASQHAGMSADATRYLINNGIKVMGIDGWGWDIPFAVQADRYKKEGKPGILWAAHFVGKEAEYCQIEKLANLDKLPPFGFTVATFPVKIKGAGAGWARPVAIFFA